MLAVMMFGKLGINPRAFSGARDCAHDCAFSGAQFCAHDCAFSGAQDCAHDCAFSGAQFCAHDCAFSGARDCAHDCAFSGAQFCAHDCAFSGAQFCAHDCHSGLLRRAARVCETVACASSGQTRQPCAPPQTTESETARVCEACGPRLLLYRPGNPRPKLRSLNLQPHLRTQTGLP